MADVRRAASSSYLGRHENCYIRYMCNITCIKADSDRRKCISIDRVLSENDSTSSQYVLSLTRVCAAFTLNKVDASTVACLLHPAHVQAVDV